MQTRINMARDLLRDNEVMTQPVLKKLQTIQKDAEALLGPYGKRNLHGDVLPSYDSPAFNEIFQRKQEFREHASAHTFSSLETGWKASCDSTKDFELTDIQLLLRNFMSPGTPYNGVLLNHGVGVGKTCTAVTIAENFPTKKVLVLTSPGLQQAFRKQVFDVAKIRVRADGTLDLRARTQCTGTQYLDMIPNVHLMNSTELERRINALILKRYTFMGMDRFANIVSDLGDDIERIRTKFSNLVILVDEAHHLRSLQGVESKRVTVILGKVLQYTEHVKLVLMTATPMYNDARDVIDLVNLMLVNDKRTRIRVAEVFDDQGGITKEGKVKLTVACRGYITYMPGGSPYSFPRRLSDPKASSSGLPVIDVFGKPIPESERISLLRLTCSDMSKIQGEAYDAASSDFNGKEITELDGNIGEDARNDDDDADTDGRPDMETDKDTAKDADTDPETETSKKRGRALRIGQQLLNVVYPSSKLWAIGIKGFTECFDRGVRGPGNNSLRVTYREGVPHFLAGSLLQSYSPKIRSIVDSVVACKGVSLCYSRFVWSGAVPLAIAFEHAGFSRYGASNILKSTSTTKSVGRYVIITGSQEVGGDSDAEIAAARASSNVDGENIKLIIVTSKASEGVDLRFVRQIHILEPWYNLQKLTQIFGRASRHCSHALLPPAKRNFTLFLHVIQGKNTRETLDLRAYRISESKQRRIDDVQRVLHSTSFDCSLNKARIEEDKHVRETTVEVEDCYGISRKVDGKLVDGFVDVIGKCEIQITGPVDASTYELDKHAYGLDVYERGIRSYMKQHVNVSYDLMKVAMSEGMTIRDDFLSLVLSRMIQDREPITDTMGRSCIITHRGDFYIAEPLDDGKVDPTFAPRRRLEIGTHTKGHTSKLVATSLVSSPTILVRDKMTIMVAELGLPPSTESKVLVKHLDNCLRDAVIDRLNGHEMNALAVEVIKKRTAHPKVFTSMLAAGILVQSSTDDDMYIRGHSGKWYCPREATLSDCDAVARVDPSIVECMNSNRVLRSIAVAALVRTSKGVNVFRLLTEGSKKQGSICSQTSTYTLSQLRSLCETMLQASDPAIPVSPLSSLSKKRLCHMYELALRYRTGVFARPSQMLDI